jgi:hypothetical protein
MASFTLSEVIGSPRDASADCVKDRVSDCWGHDRNSRLASAVGRLAVRNDCDVDFRHRPCGHAFSEPCASLLAMREVEASGLKDADDLANAALNRKGSPLSRSRRGTTQAPI